MDKKGQVYILAAILLAVIIYGLSVVVNFVEQEEVKGDFEALSKNYEIESAKLINSVLQSGEDVPSAFANFTLLFTSYSKAKSPNFYIFYALPYGDNLFIGNFMRDKIYVYKGCPTGYEGYDLRVDGCLGKISAQMSFEGLDIQTEVPLLELKKCVGSLVMEPSVSEYCVRIGGMMHSLPIDKNVPRIYGLSSLKSGSQTLQSVQGFGKWQFCGGKNQGECRDSYEFCCWSDDKCLEGACTEELGGTCGDGICDIVAGENCNTCPYPTNNDCPCADECTLEGSCSEYSGCSNTDCGGTGDPPCCPGSWCDVDTCKEFWTTETV